MRLTAKISSAGLFALVAACASDGPTAVQPETLQRVAVAEHLMLVRAEPTGDGVERLALVPLIEGLDVASLEGELRFDPMRVTISSVTASNGDDGTSRFVNRAALSEGHIRFAAFAPERLSEGALLLISVEGDPVAAMRAISAELKVVGDASGRAVKRAVVQPERSGVVR